MRSRVRYLVISLLASVNALQSQDLSTDSLIALAQHFNQLSRQVGFKNPDSAFHYAAIAQGFADAGGSSQQAALSHFNKAFSFHVRGEFVLAEEQYDSSLLHQDMGVDSVLLSRIWNNLGALHNVLDNYPKALEFYQQSLSYKLLLGNEQGAATTYNNLGIIKYNQEKYSEALDFYREAMKITLSDDTAGLSRVYGNIGLVYTHTEDYDSALSYYSRAYEIWGRHASPCSKMYAANGLAEVHQRLGDFQQSEVYAQESLEAGRQCSDPSIISGALLALGLINKDKGKVKVAEKQYLEVFRIAEENGMVSTLEMTSRHLFELYKDIGEIESALNYKEKQAKYRDSLFNEDLSSKITRLEMEYDFNREKDSLSYQFERERSLLDRELEQKSLIQQVGVIILVLAFLAIVFFARSYYLKRKSNQLLAEKNEIVSRSLREKEIMMGEIHHRVKNNLQIVSSLLNIQEKLINDESSKTVIRDTKSRVISMSLVHENLLSGQEVQSINAQEYLKDLLDSIQATFRNEHLLINFKLEIQTQRIPTDMAIHIGLIVNEAVTNSVKYAFPEGHVAKPEITIELRNADDSLFLKIKDNGVGIESGMDESYGLKLMRNLAESKEGNMELSNGDGTTINVRVPIDHEQ